MNYLFEQKPDPPLSEELSRLTSNYKKTRQKYIDQISLNCYESIKKDLLKFAATSVKNTKTYYLCNYTSEVSLEKEEYDHILEKCKDKFSSENIYAKICCLNRALTLTWDTSDNEA